MSCNVFCQDCGGDLAQSEDKSWIRVDGLTCIYRAGHVPQYGVGPGYGEGYVAGRAAGYAAADYASAYGGQVRYHIPLYYQRDHVRQTGYDDGWREGEEQQARAEEE